MRIFALAACTFLLAGCASSTVDPEGQGGQQMEPKDAFEAVRRAVEGLPCDVPVDAATSDNLARVANITFEEGGTGDIDIRGRLLATTRSLHDVSDPLQPVQLSDFSEFDIQASGDVKFLADNQTLVTGTGDGILLIDIRDPSEPRVEDHWTFGEFTGINLPGGSTFLNAHMLFSARIAGDDWVFLAPNSNSGIWILRVEGEVGSRVLTYVTQTLPAEGGPLGPHDLFAHQDPFTEEWLLYSADGFHGWTVFNIDDPANPTVVGGYVLPQPGYTHTIQSTRMGERRIVVTIAEVGENLMQVFDATILQAPILLAAWQVEVAATTPQHNLNIVEGLLYVAHYGYGMFVFDLDDAGTLPAIGTTTVAPIAHYDPVPGGNPYIAGIGGFEAVYDVIVQDGLLYVSGFSPPVNGIDILAFGCITPGDSQQRSVG
ncbi:MAG: hypothetical protein AABX89_05280 [Candidatus Thermoplasmatota archaeon]